MERETCRMPGCDEERRERGELEYPNRPELTASNGERYRVSAYGAKFCSVGCELKYEHIKEDARQARMDEEEQTGIPDKDLPERDGPPY